jgi:K+-transporting ATPase c subunit
MSPSEATGSAVEIEEVVGSIEIIRRFHNLRYLDITHGGLRSGK